ncbi:MAG: hypothetical protein AAGA60_29245 [Cyanobacteria bacterium P01_E01_bin.42]
MTDFYPWWMMGETPLEYANSVARARQIQPPVNPQDFDEWEDFDRNQKEYSREDPTDELGDRITRKMNGRGYRACASEIGIRLVKLHGIRNGKWREGEDFEKVMKWLEEK